MLFVPSHLVALATLAVETAVVIDIGLKEATVMPVFSGVQVLSAWQAQPIAGEAVHEEIRRQLTDIGVSANLLTDDIVEEIKGNSPIQSISTKISLNIGMLSPLLLRHPVRPSKTLLRQRLDLETVSRRRLSDQGRPGDHDSRPATRDRIRGAVRPRQRTQQSALSDPGRHPAVSARHAKNVGRQSVPNRRHRDGGRHGGARQGRAAGAAADARLQPSAVHQLGQVPYGAG